MLRVRLDAPVCLAYPSPYGVGMSSLGFQTLYRQLNEDGPGAHRAFLPDAWEPAALPWPPATREAITSYESDRPISSYPILGLSVAYELEVGGVVRLLEGAGIPVLASQRGPRDPIVVGGGPLTGSNPSAMLPFVDVLIAGEAEAELPRVIEVLGGAGSRQARIAAAADISPSVSLGELVPGEACALPIPARAPTATLPAHSAIVTPHSELSDMFLIEPERGCSRRCTFCVMRGPTTGGMRLLDLELPLSLIPEYAKRVGLVGAAVTDHPRLETLVARIVEGGRGVGISSLRADRLTPTLVANLARGGYRQITVASDGISERLREVLIRKIVADDLRNAANLVAQSSMKGLKVYQMIGAPTETDDDVEELVAMATELADIAPLTLTISTFVAKRNTPLDGMPFVGVKTAEARLRTIRRRLGARVKIRPQSPRWAHIEYLLAQRGVEGGHAALQAVHAGGRYRDWVDAFARAPVTERPLVMGDEARQAGRRGFAAGRSDRPRLPVTD